MQIIVNPELFWSGKSKMGNKTSYFSIPLVKNNYCKPDFFSILLCV